MDETNDVATPGAAGATGAEEAAPPSARPSLPPAASPERELNELRREVLDARNLVIKSDNLLRGLHVEVKAFAKRQEEAERRSLVSSGVAYAVFAGLCALGAWATARSYVATAKDEAAQAVQKGAAATAEARELAERAAAARTASRAAARVYDELSGDASKRETGLVDLAKLDRKGLTPLESRALDDRVGESRKRAAALALERGRTALRKNDMKGAAAELSRYFEIQGTADADLEASFELGNALWEEQQFAAAAGQLARFVKLGRGMKNRDYAALLLGESLERSGKIAEAEEAYRAGLAERPDSSFAPQMQHRLHRLLHPEGSAASGRSGAAAPGKAAASPAKPH